MIQKNPPPKRKKRNKNYYFTQDHEDAIVRYAQTNCIRERTELYVKWIQPAFNEMVDKIVFTYKFTNLPNCDVLRDECKIWLMTILDKYDQSKGSKAFSYFSVITKNWFIHKVKKNAKRARTEVLYDEMPKEIDNELITTHNKYDEIREEREFWESLWSEIESWDTANLKENEKKVLEAIKILLNSIDEDQMIYNKKAIYLYLRELTGLNTKQIVNNLNKLRTKYRIFKKNWVNGKI